MTTWAGTGEFHRVAQTNTALVCTPDEPLDALSARVVLNNTNHLADEFAQVRVNWGDPVGRPSGVATAYQNVLLGSWIFPATQRQSGNTYKFRIRLAGHSAGTSYLRAILGSPPSSIGPTGWGLLGDREFRTGTLGASAAWMTGTSQGPDADGNPHTVPQRWVAQGQPERNQDEQGLAYEPGHEVRNVVPRRGRQLRVHDDVSRHEAYAAQHK